MMWIIPFIIIETIYLSINLSIHLSIYLPTYNTRMWVIPFVGWKSCHDEQSKGTNDVCSQNIPETLIVWMKTYWKNKQTLKTTFKEAKYLNIKVRTTEWNVSRNWLGPEPVRIYIHIYILVAHFYRVYWQKKLLSWKNSRENQVFP